MAKMITRTITQSQIVVGELIGDEVKAIGSIVEDAKVDETKALKIVRKAFPTQNVLILDILVEEGLRQMSQEDFVKYSTPVEKKEEVEQVEADLSEELPA